ncbi:MAG: glycosyltransferase family A protein [Bacteroidia bacterium]
MSSTKTIISSPFFSVIITTYNRAQLLKRALDSLINQTEQDWEAIIVDDGSTDETQTQILSYLNEYPQIKYFKKNHSGQVHTKNEGVRLSTGKFVSFLDSDDEYTVHHLESRKHILVQNPTLKFLHGGVKIIGIKYVPDRFDHSKNISLDDCVIGGTFFIDRSVLLLLGAFSDVVLGEDADLYDRAVGAGISILKTNSPTYIYHHETEDSITNNLRLNS